MQHNQIVEKIKTIVKEVCGDDYTNIKVVNLRDYQYNIFIQFPKGDIEFLPLEINEMHERFEEMGLRCRIYGYETMKKEVY